MAEENSSSSECDEQKICSDMELPMVAPAMIAFVKTYIMVPGTEALYYMVRQMIGMLAREDLCDYPNWDNNEETEDSCHFKMLCIYALELLFDLHRDLLIGDMYMFDTICENEKLLNGLAKCWKHDEVKCAEFDWPVNHKPVWAGAASELAKFVGSAKY